jgi:hypothetical protein
MILICALALFDRLIRAEYEQHRPTWETDGRPAGIFWRARECRFITSDLARTRLSFVWLFRTPTWVAGSPDLAAVMRRHRGVVVIWHIAIVIWAGILLGAAK